MGGAVLVEKATAEFTDVTFENNYANAGRSQGGAVGLFYAQARFTRCLFSANEAVRRMPTPRRHITYGCPPAGRHHKHYCGENRSLWVLALTPLEASPPVPYTLPSSVTKTVKLHICTLHTFSLRSRL